MSVSDMTVPCGIVGMVVDALHYSVVGDKSGGVSVSRLRAARRLYGYARMEPWIATTAVPLP
jgi:hypothetical protein